MHLYPLAQLEAQPGEKRKEPLHLERVGVFSSDGAKFTVGRKVFDVRKLESYLSAEGIDPRTRCIPWLLCHGEGAGRARAECLDFTLHSQGGDWHKLVPKLKSSSFDLSRTDEDRARIAARNAGKRRPPAAK